MTIFRLYRRFKRHQDAIVIVPVILTVVAAFGVMQQTEYSERIGLCPDLT
ncbi:hypothetical protein [Achromobacter aloeverae]|nr:hypothetical protein [Achromobacter aloeverae]